MSQKVKIFRYLDDVDAFVVTDEYRRIAESLGLVEWNPVVWIGRLFMMDNDFGEHWFDNWDLREQRGLSEKHLIVDPDRFKNGADGPCNTAEFRKRFWTDVLASLELSVDLLFDKARQMNEQNRRMAEKYPDEARLREFCISDLEERIEMIQESFSAND
jgi:hypothetical protein